APRRTSARLARHLLAVYASAVLRAPRLGPGERRELAARFARDARRPRGPAPRARDSTRGGTGAGSRQSRVLARHVRPQRGRRRTAPAFVGDTTLLASVARVVREPALSAEVAFGPPLDPVGRTRRELAEETRRWIVARLGIGDEAPAARRVAA